MWKSWSLLLFLCSTLQGADDKKSSREKDVEKDYEQPEFYQTIDFTDTTDTEHFCLKSLQTSLDAQNILKQLASYYAPPPLPELLQPIEKPTDTAIGRKRAHTQVEPSAPRKRATSGPLRRNVLKKNALNKQIQELKRIAPPSIDEVKHSLTLNTLLADIYQDKSALNYINNAMVCTTYLQMHCLQENKSKPVTNNEELERTKQCEIHSLQEVVKKYAAINTCQSKKIESHDMNASCTNLQIAQDTPEVAKILYESSSITPDEHKLPRNHILFDTIELVLYYGIEVILRNTHDTKDVSKKVSNIDETRKWYALRREKELPPPYMTSFGYATGEQS